MEGFDENEIYRNAIMSMVEENDAEGLMDSAKAIPQAHIQILDMVLLTTKDPDWAYKAVMLKNMLLEEMEDG